MNTGAYILSNHCFLWYTTKSGIDVSYGFPGGSDSKESAYNVEDMGSIPGLGRSSGGGHGNPLQYSFLENPMDRRGWQATVYGVAELDTQSDLAHTQAWVLRNILSSQEPQKNHRQRQ